jgi:hypothetical protein
VVKQRRSNQKQAGRDVPALQRAGAPRCAPTRAGARPLAFEPTVRTPRLLLPQATHTPRVAEVRAAEYRALERRAAVPLRARPRGPSAVAVPEEFPPVHRLLRGSHFTYIGIATRASVRQTPSRRDRATAGAIRASRGELPPPANREPKQPLLHLPLHLHKLADPFLRSLEPPLTGAGSRDGHLPWPPARPPTGSLSPRVEFPNRPLVTLTTSPSLSPARPAMSLAGIAPAAPAGRP